MELETKMPRDSDIPGQVYQVNCSQSPYNSDRETDLAAFDVNRELINLPERLRGTDLTAYRVGLELWTWGHVVTTPDSRHLNDPLAIRDAFTPRKYEQRAPYDWPWLWLLQYVGCVVQVEPGATGAFKALRRARRLPPDAPITRTRGGAFQAWFDVPPGFPFGRERNAFPPGIRLLTDYVELPPEYPADLPRRLIKSEIPLLPDWIAEIVAENKK
jgi:hypothetical protein